MSPTCACDIQAIRIALLAQNLLDDVAVVYERFHSLRLVGLCRLLHPVCTAGRHRCTAVLCGLAAAYHRRRAVCYAPPEVQGPAAHSTRSLPWEAANRNLTQPRGVDRGTGVVIGI